MPKDVDDFFAEAARRTRRLMEQLAAAPEIEISGLVEPASGSLSRSQGETNWTFLLALPIWRDETGRIQRRTLYLRRELSDEEGRWLQAWVQNIKLARFKARVVEESLFKRPEGLLLGMFTENVADPELAHLAEEGQCPVYHDDPVLGRFVLERQYGLFETSLSWMDKPIKLHLVTDEEADVAESAMVARRLCGDAPAWDEKVRVCAGLRTTPATATPRDLRRWIVFLLVR